MFNPGVGYIMGVRQCKELCVKQPVVVFPDDMVFVKNNILIGNLEGTADFQFNKFDISAIDIENGNAFAREIYEYLVVFFNH